MDPTLYLLVDENEKVIETYISIEAAINACDRKNQRIIEIRWHGWADDVTDK